MLQFSKDDFAYYNIVLYNRQFRSVQEMGLDKYKKNFLYKGK